MPTPELAVRSDHEHVLTTGFPKGDFEWFGPGTQFHWLPGDYQTKSGLRLTGARLAFETAGSLNPSRSNAILLFTGLSPSAHVTSTLEDSRDGWWERMVGPGRYVDTDLWFVICVNTIGSCFGSSGPASINSATGRPYGLDFPNVDLDDTADAAVNLLDDFQIDELACVIGTSMGAMTALSFLATYPRRARMHINISGALHAGPQSLAIRSIQREVIRNDPFWRRGSYTSNEFPKAGMAAARKLGLLSYRSSDDWDRKFGRKRIGSGVEQFVIESYLQSEADKFSKRFDPNSYLYLSRAIDNFDFTSKLELLATHRQRRSALRRCLVLGVESDLLFPMAQQCAIARVLAAEGIDATMVPVNSPAGHDAFLVAIDQFGTQIEGFLNLALREVTTCLQT